MMNTRRAAAVLLLCAVLPVPRIGAAATIRGFARDEARHRLEGVRVCLLAAGRAEDPDAPCEREATTARKGKFAFRSVAAGRYVLAVREANPGNHVWAPGSRAVTILREADVVRGARFERRFGFGNFRPEITVTAASLPELSGFDLRADFVFLRLFAVDTAVPDATERVVFLGQVRNADGLAIKLSLPWTVRAIGYEIFSPARSAAGSIALED